MGDKRNLEGIRYLYIGAIIINVILNITYYLKGYGIDLESGLQFNLGIIVQASYFILTFLLVVVIMSLKIEITEEDREKLNNKMRFMYISHIFFIAYIIITLVIVKNRDIILSAIVMEIMYVGITVITRKIITLGLTDRLLKWQQAYGGADEYKESNFTWRYKVWLSPHVNVPFKKRWKGPIRFIYDVVLIYFIFNVSSSSGFFILLLLPDLISWIEGLVGGHTSITGICTGIVKNTSSRGSRVHFEVFVTDFENEREIKFVVLDNNLYIRENMTLTVVHGALSKRVMYVEGLNIDIR